jgi:hypothetical protein
MDEFRQGNEVLAKTMSTHLIDDLDAFGVWSNDYDSFIQKRAEAASAQLKKRLVPREIDKQSQSTSNNDFEEEMSSFE